MSYDKSTGRRDKHDKCFIKVQIGTAEAEYHGPDRVKITLLESCQQIYISAKEFTDLHAAINAYVETRKAEMEKDVLFAEYHKAMANARMFGRDV